MRRIARGSRLSFLRNSAPPDFAFHDRDVAPEGASLSDANRNLDAVAQVFEEEMERTGVRLLWGTACLFAHPRYVHGAATSPNSDAFAYAAAQVKKCLEVTHQLGGVLGGSDADSHRSPWWVA